MGSILCGLTYSSLIQWWWWGWLYFKGYLLFMGEIGCFFRTQVLDPRTQWYEPRVTWCRVYLVFNNNNNSNRTKTTQCTTLECDPTIHRWTPLRETRYDGRLTRIISNIENTSSYAHFLKFPKCTSDSIYDTRTILQERL